MMCEQLEVSIELAGAFIEAQVFRAEDRYHTLLCTPPTPWDAQASRGSLPASSAEDESETELRVGVAGQAGWTAVVYAGLGPGRTDTEYGRIELREAVELTRVELPEGVACIGATLAEGYAGLAWVQVAFVEGDEVSTGRSIDVFGTGAEPLDTGDTGLIPDSGTPAEDTGAEDSHSDDSAADGEDDGVRPSAGCGCGARAPAAWFLVLTPAFAVRCPCSQAALRSGRTTAPRPWTPATAATPVTRNHRAPWRTVSTPWSTMACSVGSSCIAPWTCR